MFFLKPTIKTKLLISNFGREFFHNSLRSLSSQSLVDRLPGSRCSQSKKNSSQLFFYSSRKFSNNLKNQSFDSNKIHEFGGFKCFDPQKGNLVYVGTLHKIVRLVKIFSISTSFFAACLQPIILKKIIASSLSVVSFFTLFTNLFIFVTPVLLHYITKRYVSSIYYQPTTKMFYASTYSILALQKTHSFRADEIRPPTTPSMFSNLILRDKIHLFVDTSLFLDSDALLKLMHYDEPLQWKIEDESEKEKSSIKK